MADVRKSLQTFLNQECVWKLDLLTTSHLKVFTSTTAVSPVFRPPVPGKKLYSMNVTMMIMKPKDGSPYITVYVNGEIVGSYIPEALFFKKVPGPTKLYLIYVGKLSPVSPDTKIPAEKASKTPALNGSVTKGDIWSSSRKETPEALYPKLKTMKVTMVGKCAWIFDGALCHYFLSLDYMVCCPAFKEFPSLSRIVNLLTRCPDRNCVPCYGARIHVDCTTGFTPSESEGTSEACPCILSCAALKSSYAPVTGNQNLLSLLFDPVQSKKVVGLNLKAPSYPAPISQVLVGVTAKGEEIECNPDPWELLVYSDFYTRLAIYNCQILKRACLHSC